MEEARRSAQHVPYACFHAERASAYSSRRESVRRFTGAPGTIAASASFGRV